MEGHYGIVGQGGLIFIMEAIMRLDTAKYYNYVTIFHDEISLNYKHIAFQKCKRERVKTNVQCISHHLVG